MSSDNTKWVSCAIEEGIAHIVMDDGKSNVISPEMLRQLNAAFDQAEQQNAVVVFTGREDIFCAGFDLKILKTGVNNAFKMLIGGFTLSKRLMSFPTPVLIACNGHAMAMGCFLLLSCDYRLGVEGEFKIAANEVAIGLTMPHSALAVCQYRLKNSNIDRAVLLSEIHNPESAVDAGFLDKLVAKEDLAKEAMAMAKNFTSLDLEAHKQSKMRLRRAALRSLRRAIFADKLDFIVRGLKRVVGIR